MNEEVAEIVASGTAIILLILMAAIVVPIVTILAINHLFGTEIQITFINCAATLFLITVVQSKPNFGRRNKS